MNRFKSFEEFSEGFLDEHLQLQYKILFRRWDLFGDLTGDILKKNIKRPILINEQFTWEETNFTIQNLIEWNAGYYNKAKGTNIQEEKEIEYYTDEILPGENLVDVFFLGMQPILNVTYFEEQTRASQCLDDNEKPNFHMILDEVGTGKTVSALYCIQNVVTNGEGKRKILIICPNNKRREWEADLKRQLGLYSHIAEKVNLKNAYKDNMKSMYFKECETEIFITGQNKNELSSELKKWNSNQIEKWDLIIIDEGHQCFENYEGLEAKKVVLLTATPIVVNSINKEGELQIIKERKPIHYIEVLKKIVADKADYILDNLFYPNDVFTQLFREDLHIEPKTRNIIFKHCERWEHREVYLDVLLDVKGGMTKLLYEQDDEFLIEGIFNKFRKEIEAKGYILEEEKPNLIDQPKSKYSIFLNHVQSKANQSNSYIVFFNTKWPADNLYKKLIADKNVEKSNLILAKKYGGKVCEVWPKDSGVSSNSLISYLMNKIDEGKKVIFITTGASGGTGLNLGKFDGVVNYELPFTGLELEQRFGRVDRMDVTSTKEKEMLFILNDDANPMLRYSTLKVNKTCEYMPIRNTVLFYKEFITANIDSLKNELERCELTEEEYQSYLSICSAWKEIASEDKGFVDLFLKHIVKVRMLDGFYEDIDGKCDSTIAFLELLENNLEVILKLYQVQKTMNYLEKEIKHWCNLLGKGTSITIESNSTLLANDSEANDEEVDEYTLQEDLIRNEQLVIQVSQKESFFAFLMDQDLLGKYKKMLEEIESIRNVSDQQVATGLFYVYNGAYYRKSVNEYREFFEKEVSYSG